MSDFVWLKSGKEVTQIQMSDFVCAKLGKEVTQTRMSDIIWAKHSKEVTQIQMSDIVWAKHRKEVTQIQMSDFVRANSQKEVTQTRMISGIDTYATRKACYRPNCFLRGTVLHFFQQLLRMICYEKEGPREYCLFSGCRKAACRKRN
ncbi:hypothetical protein V1499_15845 [Neobacillus sp. SCS-31]|uniref:hypothetical protein n=1 Tax=Neobacillus oceani TaxID=3115292 RepID=UPI0039060D7E